MKEHPIDNRPRGVLIMVDGACQRVIAQVDDPNTDIDYIETVKAFAAPASQLTETDKELASRALPDAGGRPSLEFPIFSMPAFDYRSADGKLIERYVRYVSSFWPALTTIAAWLQKSGHMHCL
jgi:hypothetical protein